jgi:PAS domain S-box-containing protein
MDLRPRWSLHIQTTLLTVFLTVASVIVVSWLIYVRGKETLYEHEVVDLRDDTNLRASEMQQEVLELGRGMRTFAQRLGDKLAPFEKNLADGTKGADFEAWWKREAAATIVRPRDPKGEPAGVRFDGTAIERVTLFGLKGDQIGYGVVRDGAVERFQLPTEVVIAPVEELVGVTARGGEGSHAVAESTGLLLEDEGGAKVCRLYIARRVFIQSKQGTGTGGRSIGVLVVRVNVTHYLTEMGRRGARHNYFLLDSAGVFLHHPDATRVGKTVSGDDALSTFARAKWGGDTRAVEDDLAVSRGDVVPTSASGQHEVRVNGLEYYHVKKRLPRVADAQQRRELSAKYNLEMATFARLPAAEGGAGPGFRYGELTADSSRVEISHATKDGLARAKKKIDEILARDWPAPTLRFRDRVLGIFGAPGMSWYDDLTCNGFVAQLTLLKLGLGTPLEGKLPPTPGGYLSPPGVPRFVSAASVAEMEQDGAVATNPARNLIAFLVCFGSAGLAFALSRYVTKPLGQIGEAAHTLAVGAKQIAESETDQNKSGKRFAVDLPTSGPKEIVNVSTAFKEMVGQLERMTSRIRRRNAEVETILRTAADGIVIFTERGEIDVANAAAEQMFGYTPGELDGVRVQRLMRTPTSEVIRTARSHSPGHSVSPESISDSQKSVERMMRQTGVEFRAIRKDGSEFWADAAFNEVPLGDRVLFTGFIRDITDRKAAEEKIQRLNADLENRVQERTAALNESMRGLEAALERAQVAARAKNTFVANMNHELRQPLNTVIGYAEAIREEAQDDGNEHIVTDLDKILTAARHLLGLINDILDMSKVEDGKLELSVREFDLAGFMKDLRTMAEPLAKKNRNALAFPDPAGLGKMTGDELRVRQMLLNLVSNACKFTTEGTVTVRADRELGTDGEFIRFAVRDTGSGMTPEQCVKLFQRFYQVDDSTKRKQGGTGLGLAITKMLAELMGGEIGVTSEPGVGSEFFIRVPVNPQHAAAKPVRTPDLPKPPPPPASVKSAPREAAIRSAAPEPVQDLLLRGVIHDFGNRVGLIKGRVEDLQDALAANTLPPPDLGNELEKVLLTVRHLSDIRDDLLELDGIETHIRPPQVTAFDTFVMTSDAVRQQEANATRIGTTIELACPEQIGPMYSDRRRVQRILLNLVENACKFTKNGRVTVEVHRDPAAGRLTFVVTDTGPGISPDQLPTLFSRFGRGAASKQPDGHGLGLLIAKGFAESLGGSIEVSSVVGKGSTFTLRLPSAAPGALADKTTLPAGEEARTVLVIDDDASTRELMQRFLEKDGFAVITAATGEEGLSMAKGHKPSLITLDVMMPGVDGWATLAALKTDATTCNIPVVMITMVDDKGRGFALGATDYVTKPVDWQRLGATLKRYTPDPNAGPVLVVDDDDDQVSLVSRMLTKEGREVMTAANGKEALERLAERTPSLILLDLMMPVMDGFDFLDALHAKAIQPPIPVIVITAKDLTQDDIKRLNGGVAQVVQKGTPESLEDVLRRVRMSPVNRPADGEEVPRA